jgi:formate dehydrogenase subunit gamma
MLHALQEAYGHVPAAAHAPICAALNITRAELHGVISFYHDFREAPAGRHVLKICRSEACKSVGADALSERVLGLLGVGWGETTPDGRVTVEPVYCLGLCACGPAAMVDGAVRGRVKAEGLVAEVAE